MAFFKKEPKPNFLSNVELIEKGYTNLTEALLGEFSVGSQDSKETVIDFPDRQIYIRSVAGVVKIAFDSSMSQSLDDRLYWAENPGIERDDVLDASGSKIDHFVEMYSQLTQRAPQSSELLKSIFHAYTTLVLKNTFENFDKHLKVRTEIIVAKRTIIDTNNLDFFDLNPNEIAEMIKSLSDKERFILNSLSISGFTEKEVVLSTNVEETSLTTDVQRFLFAAAQTNSSLSEVRKLSGGFVWATVLEELSELSELEIITIKFPGSEDALPDLFSPEPATEDYHEIANPFEEDYELEDKSIALISRDTPLEGVIVEMVNGSGEDHIFGTGEDDGSFIYEMLNDDDSEIFTTGLDDNIEDDVRKILKHNILSETELDGIFIMLRRNVVLEAELTSIEKSIADNRGRYHENVEGFEELKFEKSYILSNDDSEAGKDDQGSVEVIEHKQNMSNSSFFTVSKLEEDRYKVNAERREILISLASIISEMSGESVQGVIHRIDEKIAGIDKVSNLAFHNPKDDENEHVDPTLLDDKTVQKIFTRFETPTFFALVSTLGFNPFEETENLIG